MNNKSFELFKSTNDCCACGACFNICPVRAIEMKPDETGFLYPNIDFDLCIGCKKCTTVCNYQKTTVTNIPLKTFAAVSKAHNTKKNSASGGVFYELALNVLTNSGVVFGAAFDEKWNVNHILVNSTEDLHKLQGSKYVQSDINKTYSQVKTILESGTTVLYSGTPCQIDGLYGFLGKAYNNLYTVDVICHGVPSNKMFKEYIDILEKNDNDTICGFTFRDKKIGWGINGSYTLQNSLKKKKLWESASSYLYYFSRGWIYRDSCYSCKYACLNRPADITLGDFWGIENTHPDYIGKNNWVESEGISAVIVNSEKGMELLNNSKSLMELKISNFQNVAKYNHQLLSPTKKGNYDSIINEYKSGGWAALEKRFKTNVGIKKYYGPIKNLLPDSIKRILKRYYIKK